MTSYGLQVSGPSLFSVQFRGRPLNIAFRAAGVRVSAAIASSRSNSIAVLRFHIGVRVNRTRMTRIERIDADLFRFYSCGSAPVRVLRVLLTCSLRQTPIADPVHTIAN